MSSYPWIITRKAAVISYWLLVRRCRTVYFVGVTYLYFGSLSWLVSSFGSLWSWCSFSSDPKTTCTLDSVTGRWPAPFSQFFTWSNSFNRRVITLTFWFELYFSSFFSWFNFNHPRRSHSNCHSSMRIIKSSISSFTHPSNPYLIIPWSFSCSLILGWCRVRSVSFHFLKFGWKGPFWLEMGIAGIKAAFLKELNLVDLIKCFIKMEVTNPLSMSCHYHLYSRVKPSRPWRLFFLE